MHRIVLHHNSVNQTSLLILSLFVALFIPVFFGADAISAIHIVAVLVISMISVTFGRAIGRIFGLPFIQGFSNGVEIVIGFSSLSLFHLAITALFNLSAGQAFCFDVTIFAASLTILAKSWSFLPKPCSGNEGVSSWRSTLIDCLVIILLGLLTTLWLRESLVSVVEAKQTGVFRVWSDFLLQAAEIGYQINYSSFKGEAPYLAGLPLPFYHRASYSAAAIYGWITGDSLIAVATYFWLPVGFVMMGLGAYSLGTILGGRVAGILSVFSLFLLPDASMYGLRNGYFAFYWLLAAAPGAGYALALSFVALALFTLGVRRKHDYRFVFFGFSIALIGAFFRIHIAIPLLVLYTVLVVTTIELSRPALRLFIVAGLLVVVIGLALLFETITFAPHFFTGQTNGLKYIEAVHLATPTSYEGEFEKIARGLNPLEKSIVGYIIMLVAQHGLILMVLLFGSFALWQSRRNWLLFLVPLGLIFIHGLITFLVPTPSNGDITEWSHRSFVLIHAVLVVFLIVLISDTLIFKRALSWIGLRPVLRNSLIVLLFSISLLVPFNFGKNLQYGSLRDGPTACATKISSDLFSVSEFIKEKSNPDDIVLSSDGDPAAVLVALTGLQAYVSRGDLYNKIGGHSRMVLESRVKEIGDLKNATDFDYFLDFGKKSHARWFVLYERDWPEVATKIMEHAVFHKGNVLIFDISGSWSS